MKKTAALLAMLALLSTGALANEKLTLETQGHFAAGGITIQREGTYDNKKFGGWANPIEQGQSYWTRRFLHPDAAQALPRFCHGFARTGARR